MTIKGRLRNRREAVATQQQRIDQSRGDWEALHEQSLQRRKEADSLELDLKEREERVASLRGALNTARTNKEYAAILTEMNTIKADNAKLEENALEVMQDVDTLKAESDEIQTKIDAEQQRYKEIAETSNGEIEKLDGMLNELVAEREEAAKQVPPEELSLFERISKSIDGDAMAPIEIHGKKPPHDYICGGCFMGLNAEHENALRTRDKIRTCDSCGRILYLENDPAAARTPES